MEKKLLLTAAFGPYGVESEWADGLGMQMELLNNQITREQGIHSPRQTYYTFPLYLLAANISVLTTVLDFPKWDDFTRELKKGNYTHVGINFIVPNVLKAKRMAEFIRENYPDIKIILGGYGTIIPELHLIVPHDEACHGEGVRWMQKYFGEGELLKKPIVHPVVQNPVYQKVFGYKTKPRAAVLLPGVGCNNGCEFCITSHHFNKEYEPIMSNGKAIYDACEKSQTEIGATGFSVMDENFLKQPQSAIDLLKHMEENKKSYAFEIFSSAEVIMELGIDFLVRLGVKMVWIGVESKTWAHSKVKDIDLKSLIAELQRKGIVVNTSAILFLDHHDEKTMREDIDWVINLGGDLTQFMNYTPFPKTAFYERLKKAGKLKSIDDLHWRHHHGASEIPWIHPFFNNPKTHYKYLKDAFRKKYLEHGSGLLNMTITAIEGYKTAKEDFEYRRKNGLVWNPKTRKYEKTDETNPPVDEFFKLRLRKIERVAMKSKAILFTSKIFSVNRKARKKAVFAQKLSREVFGKPTLRDRLQSFALFLISLKEFAKYSWAKMRGNDTIIYQPPKNKVEYNMEHLTIKAIVKKQIQEWVNLEKQFSWVESQFKKVPSLSELEICAKRFNIHMPEAPRIHLMENLWQITPETLRQYWLSAGGTIPETGV